MIVVVLGVVASLADNPADVTTGFKYALAVGVVCGFIQLGLGLIGAGAMTNMFNLSVVHGMLAGAADVSWAVRACGAIRCPRTF